MLRVSDTTDAYAAGMRIIAGLKELDGPNVNPACHTRIYSHGRRTERAGAKALLAPVVGGCAGRSHSWADGGHADGSPDNAFK